MQCSFRNRLSCRRAQTHGIPFWSSSGRIIGTIRTDRGGLVPSREEFENRLLLIALSAVIPGRVDTELFGPRQS